MLNHEPGEPENNIWHMMPIIQRQKAGWQFQQPDMNIKENAMEENTYFLKKKSMCHDIWLVCPCVVFLCPVFVRG